jgi:hypothetical protein
MGKRDAFGNEIEENPLDAMGWKIGQPVPPASMGETTPVAPASPPPAVPVSVSAPAAPTMPSTPPMSTGPIPPPAPTMPTVPRLSPTMPTQLPNIPGGSGFSAGRMIGRFISVIIFLAIFGGIGLAVFSAVDTADKVKRTFSIPHITTPQINIPGTSTPAPQTPPPSKPSQPPVGLQQGSLVRADAFASAIVKIRQQGTRAQTLRLDPTRISANVLDGSNKLRIASITWDGNVQTIKTSTTLAGASTVSLNAVSSRAPSRALARAASLLGRPARSFNYMVLLNFAGKPEWVVYFKDGKYVRASLDGRSVQRVN